QLAVWILSAPVCRDGVDVRLRLLNRDVRFQSRDAGEKIVVPLFSHRWRAIWRRLAQVRHRDPKFRRIRKPQWIGKTRRHDANDLKSVTIKGQGPAKNVRIRTEAPLPKLVA